MKESARDLRHLPPPLHRTPPRLVCPAGRSTALCLCLSQGGSGSDCLLARFLAPQPALSAEQPLSRILVPQKPPTRLPARFMAPAAIPPLFIPAQGQASLSITSDFTADFRQAVKFPCNSGISAIPIQFPLRTSARIAAYIKEHDRPDTTHAPHLAILRSGHGTPRGSHHCFR